MHLMISPRRSHVDDDGVLRPSPYPLISACFILYDAVTIVIASGGVGFDGHVNIRISILFVQMETQKQIWDNLVLVTQICLTRSVS